MFRRLGILQRGGEALEPGVCRSGCTFAAASDQLQLLTDSARRKRPAVSRGAFSVIGERKALTGDRLHDFPRSHVEPTVVADLVGQAITAVMDHYAATLYGALAAYYASLSGEEHPIAVNAPEPVRLPNARARPVVNDVRVAGVEVLVIATLVRAAPVGILACTLVEQALTIGAIAPIRLVVGAGAVMVDAVVIALVIDVDYQGVRKIIAFGVVVFSRTYAARSFIVGEE